MVGSRDAPGRLHAVPRFWEVQILTLAHVCSQHAVWGCPPSHQHGTFYVSGRQRPLGVESRKTIIFPAGDLNRRHTHFALEGDDTHFVSGPYPCLRCPVVRIYPVGNPLPELTNKGCQCGVGWTSKHVSSFGGITWLSQLSLEPQPGHYIGLRGESGLTQVYRCRFRGSRLNQAGLEH